MAGPLKPNSPPPPLELDGLWNVGTLEKGISDLKIISNIELFIVSTDVVKWNKVKYKNTKTHKYKHTTIDKY